MKKFLITLLTLLIFVACSVTVSAQDISSNGGTATTTISYYKPSSYCILIPESLDAGDSYTFSASNLNITEHESVYVVISNLDQGKITFTHESGKCTLKKAVEIASTDGSFSTSGLPENCVGVFRGECLTSKIEFHLSQENYDCESPKAGMYTATVEFSVYVG